MPAVGLEPNISAGERPQTYALDRAATGTGVSELLFQILPFVYQTANVTNNNVPITKHGNEGRAESQSWYLGGSVVLVVVKTMNFSQG